MSVLDSIKRSVGVPPRVEYPAEMRIGGMMFVCPECGKHQVFPASRQDNRERCISSTCRRSILFVQDMNYVPDAEVV